MKPFFLGQGIEGEGGDLGGGDRALPECFKNFAKFGAQGSNARWGHRLDAVNGERE